MNTSIMYGEKEIIYTLIRSQNVSGKIRIHVYPNACIEVEAPQNNSDDEIKTAVRKRARWIKNQLDDINRNKKYVSPREYVSGETHFYIGRRYCLKIIETKDRIQTVKLKSGRIEVTTRINDPVVIIKKKHYNIFKNVSLKLLIILIGYTKFLL
jgi:predicted metal-dependent hydrolase